MAISASSLHFGHLIFILSNTVHELLLLYIKQVDQHYHFTLILALSFGDY